MPRSLFLGNSTSFMVLPRSGYTLPVFACAGAIAALESLRSGDTPQEVSVNLISPPEIASIPVEQGAKIEEGIALAITRSDPGDNLDLTRDTPVWAVVKLSQGLNEQKENLITLKGGEGVGRQANGEGSAAIYAYAQQLIRENIQPLLAPDEQIEITIILPEGRQLAIRTSNAAFGVVEGLSLLGTTGIAQPLSAPGQLERYQEILQEKVQQFDCLVFCVGENGLDLSQQMGIPSEQLVKTANWLGPLLVTAGTLGLSQLLLFGYHGKLIKLAGGIFHTHHHLADGRLEVLTAHCANLGLPTSLIQSVFASPTAEAALQVLREWDRDNSEKVYEAIALTIDQRCQDYIRKHSQQSVRVGSVLFDRDRQIITSSENGSLLLSQLGVSL